MDRITVRKRNTSLIRGSRVLDQIWRWPVLGLMLLSAVVRSEEARAQTKVTKIFLPEEREIRLALEAAPEYLRADATVYVFGTSGYRKVHSGTNGFTCMVNRDGNQNGDLDLKPTCWDAEGSRTIVPVMLHVGELIAQGVSAEQIKRDIDSGFRDGRFSSPHKAGIAYMLRGDVIFDPQTKALKEEVYPSHYMIYAPEVTNEDIGVDADWHNRDPTRPYIYDGYSGGTHTAYFIVFATSDDHHLDLPSHFRGPR